MNFSFNISSYIKNIEYFFNKTFPSGEPYSTPTAIYSLRLVNKEWFARSVINVRRSDNVEKEFTALDIESGIMGDWITSGGFVARDAFVTTWYDQSGNGNHALQSADASQPKIWDSSTGLVTENGRPALDFDGVDDYLEASSSSLASVFDSTFLLCLVISPTNIDPLSNSGNNKRIIHSFNSGINTLQLVINESNQDIVDSGAGTVSASNGVFYKLQQTLLVAEMQTDKVYIDGIDSGTGTTAAGNPSPVGTGTRIGANKNGSMVNGEYAGSIQEIIIYNSDKSASRTDIENNINNYYVVYGSTFLYNDLEELFNTSNIYFSG